MSDAKLISHSEFSTWERGPDEYYLRYILGICEPPNQYMSLGKAIHECALEQKDIDQIITIHNISPSKYNIIKKISEKIVVMKIPEVEKRLTVEFYQAIFDGINFIDHIIYELKTGRPWTQEMADASKQLTMYAMVYLKLFNVMPKLILISANTTSGKILHYETKRTTEDILVHEKALQDMKDELILRGWWTKRLQRQYDKA